MQVPYALGFIFGENFWGIPPRFPLCAILCYACYYNVITDIRLLLRKGMTFVSDKLHATKRTFTERKADQQLATLLAATGVYSTRQIADAVNGRAESYQISLRQVEYDIASGLNRYRDLLPDTPEKAKLLQVARLQMIQDLALQAFVDSTKTQTIDYDADGTITGSSERRTAGDKGFLAIAKDIEIERNLLLGVRAPKEERQMGELTVVFAWAETPARSLPADISADYSLAPDEPDDSESPSD